MQTNLSSYQYRVLWAIWRKTYGFHKKEDRISISQIVKMTNLHQAHVSRTIRELLIRNMVVKRGEFIGFQKYPSKWQDIPNGVYPYRGRAHQRKKAHTQRGISKKYTQRGIKTIPNGAGTKEKKENIKILYTRWATDLYEGYPRKGARQDAIRNIIKLLAAGISLKDLTRARDNYIAKIESKGTDPEYIIQANNFYGLKARWREFLEEEPKPKGKPAVIDVDGEPVPYEEYVK